MSIGIKTVAAMMIGGFLGFAVVGTAQMALALRIYPGTDNISRDFSLSAAMSALLGAVTAGTLVLRAAKLFSFARWLCSAGALGTLLWLSFDRDSHFAFWWTLIRNPQQHQSFEYWNTARNSYYGFLTNGLIFNGIPLLWSALLLWWSCKLLQKSKPPISSALSPSHKGI